jgi:hypothetical protein
MSLIRGIAGILTEEIGLPSPICQSRSFGSLFGPFCSASHRRLLFPSQFAATTLVLSLVNVNARGVTTPNIVVGMSVAYGGLIQLIAGM